MFKGSPGICPGPVSQPADVGQDRSRPSKPEQIARHQAGATQTPPSPNQDADAQVPAPALEPHLQQEFHPQGRNAYGGWSHAAAHPRL
jgi:hypothetical protein